MSKQYVVTLLVTVPTGTAVSHPKEWNWDAIVNDNPDDPDNIEPATPTELLGVVTLKKATKRSNIQCH